MSDKVPQPAVDAAKEIETCVNALRPYLALSQDATEVAAIIARHYAPLVERVKELEKDRERAENHLRGVLETTSAERERDRIDAERFRLLSSRCEELDDDPEGYYFALSIDGKSPDVFERFTAAIDAARAKEDAT